MGELSRVLVNPHITLADATQKLLEQKCGKIYVIPTYLMLDAHRVDVPAAEQPNPEMLQETRTGRRRDATTCLVTVRTI